VPRSFAGANGLLGSGRPHQAAWGLYDSFAASARAEAFNVTESGIRSQINTCNDAAVRGQR
jgi:hypothetical protein